MKTFFELVEIENKHSITMSSNSDFLFLIQRAVLLGLKEVGSLNEMQYRQAEEMLRLQNRERSHPAEAERND